jgi:glycine/D-amino acid oxidase-like deaminating enzyme
MARGRCRLERPWRGQVRSDWVIVATNGCTDRLIPKLAKIVLPVHPVQMVTEPLPEGHTISDSRRVFARSRHFVLFSLCGLAMVE